jgi:hypothetical protein
MAEEIHKTAPGEKPDPTGNVLQLVDAANKRQDDLREAERRYNDLRDRHNQNIAELRASHQWEMDAKEAARLDAIRQVDREDGNRRASDALTAIKTLADQTIALKDTLQTQVQSTALALENKNSLFQGEVNKRLSSLELAYSEGRGKSGVRDPVQDEFVKVVTQLVASKNEGSGQKNLVGWIVAGIFLIFGFFSLLIAAAGLIFAFTRG